MRELLEGSALVEPEQHAAANEPPPPLAPQPGELSEREVDYIAEPGSALLVEPEQHDAADEPPPPLAPQPGELSSEREVDYNVAAQPGEFVGQGQPAVSAAADPGPEGPGPSSAPLEMAINAPFEPEQHAAANKPEQRVAITIADEPERRARELIEPEEHVPGGEQAESEQRVAIAAANEQEQHARELIQPEQHAPGEPAPFEPEEHAAANEPEQRAAITIAAEPGSAPVEPEQHAAADEPPPPLAPQPGELSEREVDYTVAAQPGEVLGLGQPAVSAAADPDPEGPGPSSAPLEMAINAPTSRSSHTLLAPPRACTCVRTRGCS